MRDRQTSPRRMTRTMMDLQLSRRPLLLPRESDSGVIGLISWKSNISCREKDADLKCHHDAVCLAYNLSIHRLLSAIALVVGLSQWSSNDNIYCISPMIQSTSLSFF